MCCLDRRCKTSESQTVRHRALYLLPQLSGCYEKSFLLLTFFFCCSFISGSVSLGTSAVRGNYSPSSQIFVQLQRYEEVEHSARIGQPFLSCTGEVLGNFWVFLRLKILYPWSFSWEGQMHTNNPQQFRNVSEVLDILVVIIFHW